jgi:hypothetical protein
LHDDLGGQFAFSPAKEFYLAGTALCESPGSESGAVRELRTAIHLFDTGGPEDQSYGCESVAHINLTLALTRIGELDAADLEPVFGLPTEKRIDALPQRLTAVRAQLARPPYQGSSEARELDEQIEEFCRETIAGDLHSLPAGPG